MLRNYLNSIPPKSQPVVPTFGFGRHTTKHEMIEDLQSRFDGSGQPFTKVELAWLMTKKMNDIKNVKEIVDLVIHKGP